MDKFPDPYKDNQLVGVSSQVDDTLPEAAADNPPADVTSLVEDTLVEFAAISVPPEASSATAQVEVLVLNAMPTDAKFSTIDNIPETKQLIADNFPPSPPIVQYKPAVLKPENKTPASNSTNFSSPVNGRELGGGVNSSPPSPVKRGGLGGGVKSSPPSRRMRKIWRNSIWLAMRDLVHDRKTSLVLVFTVAAIIAPIMLLFGLRNGIVSTLFDTLLKDPRNLQITIYGNMNLERAWFKRYALRPDVRFIVPETRTINATINLTNTNNQLVSGVELIVTKMGDPLLPADIAVPTDPTIVLVTKTLADKLSLMPGASITGIIHRGSGVNRQNAMLQLRVGAIIPESSFAGDAVFCHLDLLVATEDFRDGFSKTLTTAQLSGNIASNRTHFANARVYATDLAGVAAVAAAMRAEGIEIRTQAEKILSVTSLVKTLTFVFMVIALIGVVGGMLALGGALWVNIDRKRRNMALLRLYGFGNLAIVLVPLVQSIAIAAGGLLLAYAGYLGGAAAFNSVFGVNLSGQGYVCLLNLGHLLQVAIITLIIALFAASAAGYRASQIDAAESLREI